MDDADRDRAASVGRPSPSPPLPSDALIIVAVRNTVLFPGLVLPIAVGRPGSVAAAQQAVREQRQIGVLLQRDPAVDDPAAADMHRIGAVANIVRYVTAPDGAHHIVCQGDQRFQILDFLDGWPFLVARVVRIPEPDSQSPEIEARFLNLQRQAVEALQLLPQAPPDLLAAIQSITSPAQLADLATAYMDVKPEEKQEILETIDVAARMGKVSSLLAQRIEVLRLSQEIGRQTKAAIDERQREVLLREQLAAIRRQLGEGEEGKAEIAELGEAITKANMPKEVEDQARKELRRLERMPEASAEHGMVRTYLDWLTELPWALQQEAPIDIAEARRILDEDHYGLDKIKRRIIEYLAVRKLAPQGKAPILCLVGPPGVGKTSLGQSIARALDRKFMRMSLGGLHDEAEIRGHRRTYIGAMPGRIIQVIKRVETKDPVIMLDEVDKVGADWRGDPSSALLEVLDPEQNKDFRDNYLDVPFDLSKVMFITTANQLDTIPPPLLDRMEVLHLPGYTEHEKLNIAKKYLIPKETKANALKTEEIVIEDDALRSIIKDYTREAGVRNLEREIANVCRKVAKAVAEGKPTPIMVKVESLHDYLGNPKFFAETAVRIDRPGVVTGLAWTPTGGDILFIEATMMPGNKQLTLTGQLGDVMKESAQAALSYVRSQAEQLGINKDFYEKTDIHIHVPAGAIPKDGPSAGVTMTTALVSLLTGKLAKHDVAMTGEITLRGKVMPIGGVKEKVLAAKRAGIKTVILPEKNKNDLEDVPEDLRKEMNFIFVDTIDQVIDAALDGKKS
jgi:ATP-dependent Lon protease